ncbi:MAG: hypothetical protein ACE5I1_15720 [bacterium]
MSTHTVIGYFAYKSKSEIVCDGDSCVIAGSEKKIRDYISTIEGAKATTHTIKKTRFGEILTGMKAGAPYSFDEEAFNRFYPLAQKEGLEIGPQDFSRKPPKGTPPSAFHFVRVQMMKP